MRPDILPSKSTKPPKPPNSLTPPHFLHPLPAHIFSKHSGRHNQKSRGGAVVSTPDPLPTFSWISLACSQNTLSRIGRSLVRIQLTVFGYSLFGLSFFLFLMCKVIKHFGNNELVCWMWQDVRVQLCIFSWRVTFWLENMVWYCNITSVFLLSPFHSHQEPAKNERQNHAGLDYAILSRRRSNHCTFVDLVCDGGGEGTTSLCSIARWLTTSSIIPHLWGIIRT